MNASKTLEKNGKHPTHIRIDRLVCVMSVACLVYLGQIKLITSLTRIHDPRHQNT